MRFINIISEYLYLQSTIRVSPLLLMPKPSDCDMAAITLCLFSSCSVKGGILEQTIIFTVWVIVVLKKINLDLKCCFFFAAL